MIKANLGKEEMSLSLLEMIPANDIEEQCAKIASWLKQHCNVGGIGFFLHDTAPTRAYIYTEAVPKDIFEQLEGIISRIDQTKAANNEVLFFGQKEEQVAVFKIQEEQPSFEPTGLAIPLVAQGRCIGTLSLSAESAIIQSLKSGTSDLFSYISPISYLIDNCISHEWKDKKMRLLNLYQTVSSSMSYIGDLQELLTTITGIVTSELLCEESSILLYDEETNEFEFFTAFGETGMELVSKRFPADRGIAGRALKELKTQVVNDVQSDPDFYCAIDEEHGFQTKSILSAPLISGNEKVGTINAINKIETDYFDKEDDQILSAIADEVALAVKNARLFEYVVDSYCKIRQGKNSCKGCKRPLKTWTPCVKYLNP